jgi:hypothetical protein
MGEDNEKGCLLRMLKLLRLRTRPPIMAKAKALLTFYEGREAAAKKVKHKFESKNPRKKRGKANTMLKMTSNRNYRDRCQAKTKKDTKMTAPLENFTCMLLCDFADKKVYHSQSNSCTLVHHTPLEQVMI